MSEDCATQLPLRVSHAYQRFYAGAGNNKDETTQSIRFADTILRRLVLPSQGDADRHQTCRVPVPRASFLDCLELPAFASL